MSYNPALKDRYLQNAAIAQILHERGRVLMHALKHTGATNASIMFGEYRWGADGVRYALREPNIAALEWLPAGVSEVVMTPDEIDLILEGKLDTVSAQSSYVESLALVADIERFKKSFEMLGPAVRQVLHDYVAASGDGDSWAHAMRHVVTEWGRTKRD
jgi:hypothetical protein